MVLCILSGVNWAYSEGVEAYYGAMEFYPGAVEVHLGSLEAYARASGSPAKRLTH